MIEKKVLANNVVLITEKIESAKTASIGLWFSAGSRYENKENRGISHLTEHLLFKGTESVSARNLALSFDRMGGFINAFTERENVCVYCAVPALNGNFETAAEHLFDMSQSCVFPQDEFEKEKCVVQNEISAVLDDSDESALDELARTVWDFEPLSSPIGGSVEDVERITREDVVSFYEEHFINGELLVIACGKIDCDFLEKKAAALKNKKPFFDFENHPKFINPVAWKSCVNFSKAKFSQAQVFLNFPVPCPLEEKESYALCIFDAVAGDSMSSRLFQTLREKNGLCYNVYSFFTFYEKAALWSCYASCNKEDVLKTVTLLVTEIKNFLTEQVSDEEIENAKSHICGEEIMGSSDCEYLMKRHQKNFSLKFPLRNTEEVIQCIRSIEKNDIIKLVEKIIDVKKMNLIVYGPKIPSKIKKEILWLAE